MATQTFLRALVDLAICPDLDSLLDRALALLDRELGMRGWIELWDGESTHLVRGEPLFVSAAHRTWLGTRYTVGAIYLATAPPEPADVELLARQLAPLAELMMDREASRGRSIRDDIERLYERRIRDALVRHDGNISAVARELDVGRARVAEIARRWRTSVRVSSRGTAASAR